METIQETTVWEDNTPNHTYLLVNDKAVAYRKATGEIQVFTKPMRFEKRYRKFKKVVDNELVQSYTVCIS